MDNVNFVLLGASKNRFTQGIRKSKSGPVYIYIQDRREGGAGRARVPGPIVLAFFTIFLLY
jgi:hypothetical protein